jgi:hypothetical protein
VRLSDVVPDRIWSARATLRLGPLPIRSRMTVIRLDDGALWVHSPIAPDPELAAELRGIGPVRFAIAPNKMHHRFLLPFLSAFPGATGFVPEGLLAKRPDLSGCEVLTPAAASRWLPELRAVPVLGIPALDETAWLHPATKTLLLTDLLFCTGPDTPAPARVLLRAVGVSGRLRMSRTMRWMVRDERALARTVRDLLALDFERVVVAHDHVVERDGRGQLREAFAWLADAT